MTRRLIGLALLVLAARIAQAAPPGFTPPPSLSGYVKAVSSIGPDTSGNVPGLATTAMVQTAIVDVIQMSASPASGATVQASAGTTVLFVNNPTLLLALTVGLPPSPVDGQRFTVCTNAAITTMGFTGGTVKGALGSFSASGYARFIYSAPLAAWFRAG